MKNFICLLLFFYSAVFIISCKNDSLNIAPEIDTPIIMVHGFLASSDTYEKQYERFLSNNYKSNMLYALNYNSLDITNASKSLDEFVDEVLLKTGAKSVDLIGHSLGSTLVYEYCKNTRNAKKIKHLVLLAAFKQNKPGGSNGEIPTLNVWSTDDKVVAFGGFIPNAKNIQLQNKDHYQVATCEETFSEIFKFFTGQNPTSTIPKIEDNPVISGHALSFGENLSSLGSILNIYKVNKSNGKRLTQSPIISFTINVKNEWGPFVAEKNAYYEFETIPKDSKSRIVHYYREPFYVSNKFVVIRTFPPQGSLGLLFLQSLPSKNGESVLAFFSASQAVITGRDELLIDDFPLSKSPFTDPNNTMIALFAYDVNANKKSDFTPANAFTNFPFLKGVDFYFESNSELHSTFSFNNRVLNIPHLDSKLDGVEVAVFN